MPLDPERLAELVSKALDVATWPLLQRIAVLESTPPVPSLEQLPGIPGERGLQGDKGDPGAHGEIGPQGERGERGEQGPIGLTGDKGLDGRDGKDGEPGLIGPRGENGLDGKDATRGPDELSLEDLTTHSDVLMRKTFADLDAAAPRRIDRVPVRDAKSGRILRVVEVEHATKG